MPAETAKRGPTSAPSAGPPPPAIGLGATASPVRRAFAALESLADGPRAAADIARVLRVNRSTALRLMSELQALGYVRRDPSDKRYESVAARLYPLIGAH